jgi:hypothetical protein
VQPAVATKLNALLPELYDAVSWLVVVGVIATFEEADPQYWALILTALTRI